jgi:hypothetical protein
LWRLKVSDREDPFAAIIRCTADPAKADTPFVAAGSEGGDHDHTSIFLNATASSGAENGIITIRCTLNIGLNCWGSNRRANNPALERDWI